jgi:hypothetical protein
MEDINSAQDAILNNVAETPTKNNGRNDFWKSLLRTVLGISISIILTFGTNALLLYRYAAKDRKMTAMMVIGNIETFANHLDQCADHMSWNDTLAAYLLAIPIDSLDLVDQNQLLFGINNVTAYYTLNHDKSAENIFSNSIDTWKNIGIFEFIENTGQCFADIKNIKEIYDDFLTTTDRIRNRLIQNLEACPGNTLGSKALHDKEYRNHLAHIHSQSEYYHYLAAYVRWKNSKNMQLMNISEEELRLFIEERDKKQITLGDAPEQESFRTPVINPDSLPDMKDWIK